ncbi:MAG: PmoA family protein [Sedimentisphaerales bacterium]|nr:PmoA family protein [Sedimentisphaerales bacterium]
MGKRKILIVVCLLIPAVPFCASAKKSMNIKTEQNIVTIEDDKILMRYRYKDVPFKPYVQELFSPGGVNVLRDAPSDHLHHHALMYAVAVNGVNFWEEQQSPGRQAHSSFTETSARTRNDISVGKLAERLNWVETRSDELLLKEFRAIKICKPKEHNATILCWQSMFYVPSGKEAVTLSGSHYFGLGMRFVQSMDTGGEFFNSEGKEGEVVRGDEKLVRANWCAYTAKANGKTVTVAMFGHPDNLRHPAYWFTMTKPFAYLSATLNLHREPLEIPSDKPLSLYYAVVVWDNRIDKEQVQKVYDWWIKSDGH